MGPHKVYGLIRCTGLLDLVVILKIFSFKAGGLLRRSLLATGAMALLLFVCVTTWLSLTIPVAKSATPLVPARIVLLTREGVPFAAAGPTMDAPVKVADLPPYVAQAFYAIEDRRFEYHFGVDPIGISRAFVNNLTGGARQGGSTITQQLAKNVYLIDPETGTPYPGYSRKLKELSIAMWLEAWLTKDEILERYLSNVAFGKNIYGLRAASLHYFYRQPENLTLPQAIMLAGLVQAPSRYDPTSNEKRARARAARVSQAMQDAGYLPDGTENLPEIAKLDLRIAPPVRTHFYFSDWVIEEARARAGQGYAERRVTTTLDRQLQIIAQDVVRNDSPASADVALVAMRPNGEVVAMIGGRDYSRSQFNIAVSGRRQPGSTFKLFTYLTALEQGMRPGSPVSNAPITEGEYRPVNSDGVYGDSISLEKAFATSSNVAAVRLFEQVGANAVVDTARALGVNDRMDMTPALALGTSDVSLLRMTAAYAAIAAGRASIEPVGLPPASEEASNSAGQQGLATPMDPRVVSDMRIMLERVVSDGTGRRAQLPVRASGKTGTTQNNRDAWFIGYAQDLVVGVWLGNESGKAIKGFSGGDAAARMWRAFMIRAFAANLLRQPVSGGSGLGAGRETSTGALGSESNTTNPSITSDPARDSGSVSELPELLRGDDGEEIDLSRRLFPTEGSGATARGRIDADALFAPSRTIDPRTLQELELGGDATTRDDGPASSPATRRVPPSRNNVTPRQKVPRRTGSSNRPRPPDRARPQRRRSTAASDDEDEDFTIDCGEIRC